MLKKKTSQVFELIVLLKYSLLSTFPLLFYVVPTKTKQMNKILNGLRLSVGMVFVKFWFISA